MKFGDALIAGITAIVTLAIVATLVSRNAQTPQVISAGASGLSNVISAATNPYGGGSQIRPSFGDF